MKSKFKNRVIAAVLVGALAAGTVIATVGILIDVFSK